MALITTQRLYCDKCSEEIKSVNGGFCVQGNIYKARIDDARYGLIGNNFPIQNKTVQISVDTVKTVDFCTTCFLEVLGLDD